MNLPENIDPTEDNSGDSYDNQPQNDDIHSDGTDEENGTSTDDVADVAGIQDATDASEAAFTLGAERGISPDPDGVNDDSQKDDYNIKQ